MTNGTEQPVATISAEVVYDIPKFGIYSGDKFLSLNFKPRQWMIQDLIKEGDSCLLVGHAKAGKSLLVQQICFSLCSGNNFLDLPVLAPQRVLYVMLEGDLSDMQDRYKRMSKAMEFKHNNFWIYFSAPIAIAEPNERNGFLCDITDIMPTVLIIDPIYMVCIGKGKSLSDDSLVRDFIGSMRIIKEKLNCTLIVLHHTHKPRKTSDGDLIDEGDDALFGSEFFKAWPDHILLFKHHKTSDIRTLSCTTQRSGEVEKEIKLKLVQDPLHFEELPEDVSGSVLETSRKRIRELLESFHRPLSAKEIYSNLGLKRPTFHSIKNKLIEEGMLIKTGKNNDTCYLLKDWFTT